MASDGEIRAEEFMEIYDRLTPENQARLAAFMKELIQVQKQHVHDDNQLDIQSFTPYN